MSEDNHRDKFPLLHRVTNLEAQFSSLKQERDELARERESYASIAIASLRALRRQRGISFLPEGIWIEDVDKEVMKVAERESEKEDDRRTGGTTAWNWTKVIPSEPNPRRTVPIFLTDLKTKKQPRTPFVPRRFRRTFPFELLGIIASFCDLPTLKLLCLGSSQLLAIAGPLITREVGPLSYYTLARLLCSRTLRSPKLNPDSLERLRILSVAASQLVEPTRHHVPIASSRLSDGITSIPLISFTILMNLPISDGQAPDAHPLFTPSLALLSLLNPERLVVEPHDETPERGYEGNYDSTRISSEAGRIVSSWSRLRTVKMDQLDLHCTVDDAFIPLLDGVEPILNARPFFIGGGGRFPIASPSLKIEWDVGWTLLPTELTKNGFESFPRFLVLRDELLDHPSIVEPTIKVWGENQAGLVQGELAAVEETRARRVEIVDGYADQYREVDPDDWEPPHHDGYYEFKPWLDSSDDTPPPNPWSDGSSP